MLLLIFGSIVECSVQSVEAQKPYFMTPTTSFSNMGLSLDNKGMLALGSNKLPVTFGTNVKNDEPDVMYVNGKPMCMRSDNFLGVCQGGEIATPLRPKWKNSGIRVKYVAGNGVFGKSELCLTIEQNAFIKFEPCGDNNNNQEWVFTAAPPSNVGNNNPNGSPYGGGPSGGSYGWSNNLAGNNNAWNSCNNAQQGYPMTGQGAQANCYQQGTFYDQSNCSGMLLSGQQGCVPPQTYSMNGPGQGQGQQNCLPSSQNCTYPAINMSQMNGQNCTPMNGTGQMGGDSCNSTGYSVTGTGQSASQDYCTPAGYPMAGTGQPGVQGCPPSTYQNLLTMNSNGSCANMMGC